MPAPLSRAAAALLLACAALSALAEDSNVRCLRGVHDSLSSSSSPLPWNFANSSAGFICFFTGVSCWNDQENRVFSLSLSSMSLTGQIPSDLRLCSDLQTLDLSSNSISGVLPPAFCDWLPYLVTLDLSSNQLSGPIPAELSNCRFLNTLVLDHNRFTGPIPASLSRLDRLKRLSLSDNQLSGAIPPSLPGSDPSSFANNPSLCGHPLSSCGSSLSRTSLIIIIASGVLGAAVSLLIAFAVWRYYSKQRPSAASPEDGLLWANRLRASQHRLTPVSLFHKPIVKVKFSDLMAASNGFHPNHIVIAGSSRTGTSYKAVLPDGSALSVKRLHGCDLPEKQFRSEMSRLGQLRHPNLVPLLGFCIVEDERLLVYKHMPNGPLSTLLTAGEEHLDWPTRLKLGVGAARGLAWLHHGLQMPYIHQNISSTAILLDEDYEPRLTDIGILRLAKPTEPGDSAYLAPEQATAPMATMKSDVYAFGVVLLELVTGQKPSEITTSFETGDVFKGKNLVDWVTHLSNSGRISDAVDVYIKDKGHEKEIKEFMAIACQCVVARPPERPSMYKVYNSLKAIGDDNEEEDDFDEFPLTFGKDSV
ncbi:hypothetical protein J5N97_021050 [Dioscorea zingiberensis]|uniref:Protein kinase domain-containing protein n=1 Tax=Dioscorea zingiberensis TaxID=325984 RepID=A0A9D5CGY4_9LILI|nr:hypothetical protein J5N97_021050 [Dioscorea zingiberensis]